MADALETTLPLRRSGLMQYAPALVLLICLLVMIVPLPGVLLDLLLAASIAAGLVMVLATLEVKSPLELSVFPSLLLLLTLFRLSMNIATTRQILLGGDAGKLVPAFGEYMVGGDMVVGLVIFAILLLVQFIVVTKGASRISEVNARFTLDAMPGKQMAIDAEMNSGLINEEEARRRRKLLNQEAEFFGAMDGAGKYVRGDTMAGLAITAVNLLGGSILGLMRGMGVQEVIDRYMVLTVGDGLVSQIPALLTAISAGVLVTKASSERRLDEEISTQLMSQRRLPWLVASLLAAMAFVPSFPKFPFLLLAGVFASLARANSAGAKVVTAAAKPPVAEPSKEVKEEDQLEQFLQTDRLSVEIGLNLVPVVEGADGKGLKHRIQTLRRETAQKFGLWIPQVRIRDSLKLKGHEYVVKLLGREIARGAIKPGDLLAVNPGKATGKPLGEETRDPAFQLPAYWIAPSERAHATLLGFTVVDAVSVLVTHFAELVRRHAHELLGRDDLQKMLNRLKEHAPAIVEDLRPETVKMGTVHKVLQNLLEEGVPITGLERILESLVFHAPQSKGAEDLTDAVREDLASVICERFRAEDGRIRVLLVEPRLEAAFRERVHSGAIALGAKELERFNTLLANGLREAQTQEGAIAMLVDKPLRRALRATIARTLPEIAVLSYKEIPTNMQIAPLAIFKYEQVLKEDSLLPATSAAA